MILVEMEIPAQLDRLEHRDFPDLVEILVTLALREALVLLVYQDQEELWEQQEIQEPLVNQVMLDRLAM